MKGFLKQLKILFFLILIGVIYGGAIGAGIAFLTANNALGVGVGVSLGLAGALAWILARSNTLAGIFAWTLALYLPWILAFVLPWILGWIWAVTLGWIWAVTLNYLAKRSNTTPEVLIENHIVWIFSFQMTIVRSLTDGRSSIKRNQKPERKQRAWDESLIITFTQELAEVFPEEWDEWQHWISDMMDSRTRMQSKGMNHRLVSLITFYRLTRFVWHLGIDKVYILATRRTTR